MTLAGKTIAILIAPRGTEEPEFAQPKAAVEQAGGKVVVSFVADFFAADKPVAAICHAPWTLVEADVVKGRTLTSFPTLQTDIRNAGGTWTDQEVVVDGKLVTSRNPDDLPAFCAKLVEVFG